MSDKFSKYAVKEDKFSQYRATPEQVKKRKKEKEKNPNQEMGFLNKLPRNLATGLLNMGRGFANTPHNVAGLLGHSNAIPEFAPSNFDYGEALGLPKDKTLSDKILQGIGQYGPSLAIPGSTLPRLIAGQAAFGATQDENPLKGATEGGIGGLAGGLLGKGIQKGISALRPSKLFRGNLSPEQLAKNIKITEGTETPLGSVIDSPSLKKFHENVLPNVLGSGAEKTMQRTAEAVTQKGEDLLHGMRGGAPVYEDYGVKIKNALKESASKVEREKIAKFRNVNEIADKAGVKTSRKNLRGEAGNILNQIESDPDLAKFTNSSDIKLLKDIYGIKNNPEFSLKETDILRGKIGEHAHEANIKGEKPKAAIYQRLKNALEKDVDSSIENSSIHELKNARKEAMDYYKNEYAPFQDKDLQKFIKKGGDPDLLLNHFLRAGKNDRSILLQKLTKQMKSNKEGSPENLLSSAYLAPAYEGGKLNPTKLNTLYHKLGPKQRKELFGVEQNKALKDYTSLVHKNKEAFNLMFNPKTGARLGQLGSAYALGAGHIPALIGGGLLARGANKLITSPKFREKLVNAMIENKRIGIPKTQGALRKAGALVGNTQED